MPSPLNHQQINVLQNEIWKKKNRIQFDQHRNISQNQRFVFAIPV